MRKFSFSKTRLLSMLLTSCLVSLAFILVSAGLHSSLSVDNHIKEVALEDAFVSQSGAGASSATDPVKYTAAADYIADFSAEGLYNWPVRNSPIKVYFAPGSAVPGYDPSSVQVLSDCFDEWCAASQGRLNWKRVYSSKNAEIKVRWTNQVTERAEGTEAGRTKTYARLNTITNRGTIDGADMLLLTRLPNRIFTQAEIKKAYLHEVGHAFGIAGHSHDRRDAMYYALSPQQTGHLDERDIATLDRLYGINLSVKQTNGPA